MTSRRQSLALALFLVLALGALPACGGDDDGDDARVADRSTTTAPTADDSIELLDAGQEPRDELRLSLQEGAVESQRMTMDIDMELSFGEQTQTIDSPRTIVDLDIEVEDVSDGVAALRSTLVAADVEAGEVDPQVVEQTRQLMQTMVGTTFRQRLDDRGISRGADSPDIPAGVPEQARSVVEQMSSQFSDLGVAFPSEAVGIGARWARQTDATMNGIRFDIRFVYELVERDGDDYVVATTYEQTIVPGPADIPGLGTATAVADGGRLTGTGELRGSLDRLFGTGGVRGSGEVLMHVDEDGSRTDVRQQMTIVTEMTAR